MCSFIQNAFYIGRRHLSPTLLVPLITPIMWSRLTFLVCIACLFLEAAPQDLSASSTVTPSPTQAASSTASIPTVPLTTGSQTLSFQTSSPSSSLPNPGGNSGGNSGSSTTPTSTPPDVLLNVPNLSVGRIELDVDNLQADINLNANVASLVTINAGVAVSVQKINLTIVDVEAELELIVRLGHLADIVNRVFQSLDLNPLLITALNNVTSIVDTVVGAVDGLLGTITQSGTTVSFLVDNLGNLVQEVASAGGSPVSSIVGNYLTNFTYTGTSQNLNNGLVQKTYSYSPLNALVNIVFNTAGQVVQATVDKQSGTSSGSNSTSLPLTTSSPT